MTDNFFTCLKGLFKYYVITYREGGVSQSITINYNFIEGRGAKSITK